MNVFAKLLFGFLFLRLSKVHEKLDSDKLCGLEEHAPCNLIIESLQPKKKGRTVPR
jgi:hypothetical protein